MNNWIVLLSLLICSQHTANGNYLNEWSVQGNQVSVNPGTVTKCDPTMDYFPYKATVNFAKFKIEYFKTYKVVTNTQANLKYVLYQSGCPKPPAADANDVAGAFQIPLSRVYVDSSTYFGDLELMGERLAIRLVNGEYTDNPCMWRQLDSKWTVNLPYGELWTSASGFDLENQNPIVVSDIYETTYYAANEWIKFFAAFFNREMSVQSFADAVRQRWVCNSKAVQTQSVQKKMLFLYYWTTFYNNSNPAWITYKGWEVKSCKEEYRYCELFQAAGVIPINNDTSTLPVANAVTKIAGQDYQAVPDQSIIQYAKEADIILFMNPWCDPTAGTQCVQGFIDIFNKLSGIPAVNNKQVFHLSRVTDPMGGTKEESEGQLQPDALLKDIIKMAYPRLLPNYQFTFALNLYDSIKNGNLDCTSTPYALGCPVSGSALAAQCNNLTHVYVSLGPDGRP
ncbi:hypothetical protein GUITHDRAFT_120874 [Guillardia theta CCMP2712]|uniref:Uncharacterized protein n=1 Tax=Guillardia theta (strain CCMP2712) TaxID=905079 RepID=L1I9M0_GUITC|nr:hypothetical protein GUITHDRAFT_120874 [Guillardia theta CCMP2712]EKX32923.1 hypothetical protein GUITHDRAFT_120874 [Guillardia theta CCMP2712]|eukprot:XP_005819903.1 hypothetical protein GUITHDRAFT_120874 [Guillardia theta CCMP2712]